MSQYGNFHNFCRDSGSKWATIPVCYLFDDSPGRQGNAAPGFGGCNLTGINLGGGNNLANLGSIIVDGIAILAMMLLIFLSDRKRAAVGRREMQYFLFGYLVISVCEIFTIGGFPLNNSVRRAFVAVHVASVVATTWVLLLNALVGFQLLEDGTPLSMGLVLVSSLALFIGSGYVALDTGFRWTGFFDSTLGGDNKAYGLYTLYLLLPLLFICLFFLLEVFLVLGVLGEKKPLLYLGAAALLFAVAQIFQFVISVHICNGASGKINGGFFETLLNLAAVGMVWVFWSSITEDDWPTNGLKRYRVLIERCRQPWTAKAMRDLQEKMCDLAVVRYTDMLNHQRGVTPGTAVRNEKGEWNTYNKPYDEEKCGAEPRRRSSFARLIDHWYRGSSPISIDSDSMDLLERRRGISARDDDVARDAEALKSMKRTRYGGSTFSGPRELDRNESEMALLSKVRCRDPSGRIGKTERERGWEKRVLRRRWEDVRVSHTRPKLRLLNGGYDVDVNTGGSSAGFTRRCETTELPACAVPGAEPRVAAVSTGPVIGEPRPVRPGKECGCVSPVNDEDRALGLSTRFMLGSPGWPPRARIPEGAPSRIGNVEIGVAL